MDKEKKEETSSPAIIVNEMSFADAVKEVIAGKKIQRLEWKDKNAYGFLNGELLSLHKSDNLNHKWIVSLGDLAGEDWIVID